MITGCITIHRRKWKKPKHIERFCRGDRTQDRPVRFRSTRVDKNDTTATFPIEPLAQFDQLQVGVTLDDLDSRVATSNRAERRDITFVAFQEEELLKCM